MDQYRCQISFVFQIGFLIVWEKGYSLQINIPLVNIYFGLLKEAHGFHIIRRWGS